MAISLTKTNLFSFLLAMFILALAGCSAPSTPSAPSSTPSAGAGTPPAQDQAELMVSAAASLTDALQELKPLFEKNHPGVTVTYVLGSSGKLATQIEQGAPSDLFLSASKKEMDKLDEKQLIEKESRIDFARNQLVLVISKDRLVPVSSFEDLQAGAVQHIAVGQPDSVPAGRYAKETLEHLQLWEPLSEKMVFASDVRQVLTFVESGNAEAGIVYSSDAASSDRVQVAAAANPEWHQPIVYPGAVIQGSPRAQLARDFLASLSSEEGREILKKYGFH